MARNFIGILQEKQQTLGLKQIFTYLADEEVKHYALFKGLLERQPTDYESTDILADSKNIFAQMKESGAVDVTDDVSQLEAYKQALEWEKKAYEFFEAESALRQPTRKRKNFWKRSPKKKDVIIDSLTPSLNSSAGRKAGSRMPNSIT